MAADVPDFQLLFESAPGLYLVLEPDLTIVAATDAYLHATKTNRSDILGCSLFEIFPDNPDDPAASGVRNLAASLERVRLTGMPDTMAVQKYDIRRPESEGGGFEERYWSPLNSPVFRPQSREVAYIVHRVEDVTEFIRLKQRGIEQGLATEALKSRTEQMEGEIFLRAQQLQEANRLLREANNQADAANRGKSVFLATASHDLRQPLQTLSLLNGALLRMVTDPEAAEALALQDAAIGVMSRLLNALLDISKLESGSVKPQPSDWQVITLLDQLRSEFAGIAAAKGLRLEIDSDAAWVHSDLSLIGQVLRNLLSNAIKYTRHGGVTLRCRQRDGVACLQVADSGIGMAADELAHIYREFYQIGVAPNASREGYGLGLSIVRRIVELLHLELKVDSQLGKGSTFSLSLPATAAAGAAHAEPLPGPAGQSERQTRHILVVEDEPAVLNATKLLLKSEGYTVTSATSVAEAVERAGACADLELLLTDYHLTNNETGAQVIESVQAIRGAGLQAIMITGDTSSARRLSQRHAGVRLLSKPVDPTALLTLVAELLGQR